jgi:hypothetical protein
MAWLGKDCACASSDAPGKPHARAAAQSHIFQMRMQDLPYFCRPHRRRKVSSLQPTFGLSFVIASAAKQSILSLWLDGLRRCARNDGLNS